MKEGQKEEEEGGELELEHNDPAELERARKIRELEDAISIDCSAGSLSTLRTKKPASLAGNPPPRVSPRVNDPAELERARVRRELALAITALEHNALPPMLGQEMLVPQGVRDSPHEVADLNPQRALQPTSIEHFAIGNSGWPSLNGKVWEKSQPSVINLVAHSALEACAHDDPTLFDPPSKHRLKVPRLLSTTDANALAHEDRTRFDPPFKKKHKSVWTCDSEARAREDHARFDPPFKYRLRCA